MPKISRRTALRRGGQDVPADTELLELEKRLTELREEEAAIREPLKGVASVEEEAPIVDAAEKVDQKAMEIEVRIAETPAQGLVGVAVQLRVAAYEIKMMNEDAVEDLCALSAHEAVERILKEQEATDAEIVSMWHEYRALIAEHEAALEAAARAGETGLDDERANATFEQASELCERILATQARTPAGIAVKLKLSEEYENLEMDVKEQPKLVMPQAVLSALADLERMAGRA